MKKFMGSKLFILLICLPWYPLAIFGEWYEVKSGFGGRFSFVNTTKEYWIEVIDYLRS